MVNLPTANIETARMRAEKTGSKTRELVVLHQGQSLGKITVSIGVSAPLNGSPPGELLEARGRGALRGQKAWKESGRDR